MEYKKKKNKKTKLTKLKNKQHRDENLQINEKT